MRWSQRGVMGMLLGGVSPLAQTNAPPAKPKASAVSHIEEAAKKQASQMGSSAPMGILTDTMGVDFKPYVSRVLHTIVGAQEKSPSWYVVVERAGFLGGFRKNPAEQISAR